MKLFGILFSVLLVFSYEVLAEEITVDSNIVKAIVYNDRATVTRKAIIDIKAGEQKIIFKDLPALLMPDSLQVQGKAKGEVQFGAVIFKQIMSSELTSVREKELSDQKKQLGNQLKFIDAEKHSLQARKKFIENIGFEASLRIREDIAEIKLKPEEWAKASQVIQSEISVILKFLLDYDIKRFKIVENINALDRELSRMRTGTRSTYEVTVPLETNIDTKLTIELSYQIRNVSWNPVYDARLDTKSGNLELSQFGTVRQNTGEDWDGVKLVLSTAQPQRGTSLPHIQPMWVDLYYSRNRSILSDAVGNSSEFSNVGNIQFSAGPGVEKPLVRPKKMVQSREELQEEPDATFKGAKIVTGGFVSEYEISGLVSVKSDGTETKLMIGVFDTKSELEIHIKPKISNSAYLAVRLRLKGESSILPGSVNLFRDGAFIGRSHVKLLRPEEEYVLFFGIDDQVSVKRKTIKDVRTDAGVLIGDNILERHYITTIENLHKDKVTIVVKEAIPAIRNDDIDVVIDKSVTSTGYKKDSANVKGLVRWQFEMDTKQKKDIKLGWKVIWPKNANLNGLR